MFIEYSNNAPSIIAKFKSQLDMREECRYKKQDEKNKEDLKLLKLQKEKEKEETPKQVKKKR